MNEQNRSLHLEVCCSAQHLARYKIPAPSCQHINHVPTSVPDQHDFFKDRSSDPYPDLTDSAPTPISAVFFKYYLVYIIDNKFS